MYSIISITALTLSIAVSESAFVLPPPILRQFTVPKQLARALSSSNSDDAQKLLDEAERIRKEVSAFEQKKDDVIAAKKQEQSRIVEEKQSERERYIAEVPILKGDGSTVVERVDFPPRFTRGTSTVLAVRSVLPLGIILGESEDVPGAIGIDEIAPGGNAGAAGVKVGDLLRAVTACQVTMEQPTWQLIVGGIGQPKTKRMMFSTDGKVFEEVMEAVASNRMDPSGEPAWLVLERLD